MRINEENYVSKAEKVINTLKKNKDNKERTISIVTTSQLRNLLAMSADIYNVVITQTDDKLSDEIKGKIEYLKIRIVYDAGRDPKVNNLVKASEILDCISEIQGSRKNFILFNRYLEAIVAYRKYLGGKDE